MAAFDFLCHNPHSPSQTFMVAGNTKRAVGADELAFYLGVGTPVLSISAAWFDGLPLATG